MLTLACTCSKQPTDGDTLLCFHPKEDHAELRLRQVVSWAITGVYECEDVGSLFIIIVYGLSHLQSNR